MPTPTPPHAAPGSPSDEGGRWIVAHLETLARAVNIAARSASPITALAPHRVAIAELRGVARIDAAPPLGAVLDVVGRLAGATPATAPSTALVQPTLELAGALLTPTFAIFRQPPIAAWRTGHTQHRRAGSRVPTIQTFLALDSLLVSAESSGHVLNDDETLAVPYDPQVPCIAEDHVAPLRFDGIHDERAAVERELPSVGLSSLRIRAAA